MSDLVVRYPWLFIILFIGMTLGFATQLPNLEIDPEVKNQLPEDMPARQFMRDIEARFGGNEMVMVVVTADDVLQPDVLKRVNQLSDQLQTLEQVQKVFGLFTLVDIRGEDGNMLVETAVEELPSSKAERDALAERLKGNDMVYGNVVARDFRATSLIAMLSGDAGDLDTIEGVRAIVDATPGPGEVVIGGMPEVRASVSTDIRDDMATFMPVGLSIVLIFLYVCFRQLRGVILPFSVVVMSTIVAMGLIPIFGWKVQMVTVILPVILLAVANDYGIHLMAKYQEENVPGKDRDKKRLAKVVLSDLGPPVIAAGITTMVGLLCLTSHIVVPARQMGILAAIGVLYALLGSLCFIPAVLAVLPVPEPLTTLADPHKKASLERFLHRVSGWVVRWPKAIVAITAVVTLVSASGIALLKVDTNPVNYYEAGAPVAQTADLINTHFGGSTEMGVMVEGDIQDPEMLARIDAMDRHLAALPEVGYTQSIAQIVRQMNMVVMNGGEEARVLPESRAAVAQYFLLYSMGGDPEDFERLVDFDYEHALLTARINSTGTAEIERVVMAAESWLADNPFPGPVTLAGFGPLFVELVEAVVTGQMLSLGLSILLVLVLVAFTFRSVPAGIYAVLPLLMAIPLLFGLMGFMAIELNIVTAMLSSIMIGVGVDYTIHFLWRYREERRAGHDYDKAIFQTLTTTGRGIVFNALSVVTGFSVLLISNFLPVKFFGFLVVVSISACLIGALVLLPALVLVLKPRFLEP